jgi:RNA polymerase sigma-70 factor (ECF subfamily)
MREMGDPPGPSDRSKPGDRERPATSESATGNRSRWAAAPPPREELLRLRNRDPSALASFFERYLEQIFGLAHHMMGDRGQAEEVTQEVFLKVHRALERLDPDRDPTPWLTTIVCHACREVWRGAHYKASRRSVSLEDIQDWKASHPRASGTPESVALRAERHAVVQRALLALPDNLREVVVLHDWAGLNHKEIAVALEVSHDAVRKRYSRALAALAKILKDWE